MVILRCVVGRVVVVGGDGAAACGSAGFGQRHLASGQVVGAAERAYSGMGPLQATKTAVRGRAAAPANQRFGIACGASVEALRGNRGLSDPHYRLPGSADAGERCYGWWAVASC